VIDDDATLSAALGALVPKPAGVSADWNDALARAGSGRRNRALVVGVVMLAAGALVAAPAFGLRSFVAELLGRIDAPFTGGKPAPTKIKASFYDFELFAPPSMAPGILASRARRVATVEVRGKKRGLFVAPTKKGGFCYEVEQAFGGCQSVRAKRPAIRASPAIGGRNGLQWTAAVTGTVSAPDVRHLLIRYADGSTSEARFYYVSKPIDAGFFFAERLPAGHDLPSTRAASIEAVDSHGDVVARQKIRYQTAAEIARMRALMARLRHQHGNQPRPPYRRPAPPKADPTSPLQRGAAAGVTVVAGRNGVVAFDLSRATQDVRRIVRQQSANFTCFRRVPFHSELVGFGARAGFRRRTAIMRIVGTGFRPPYDGCAIGGEYGHTWPDRYGSHMAVEVPLTERGRRFFEDRAAARDLVAFYRSKPYRTFRKLNGAAFEQAVQTSRYAGKLTPIASGSAQLPPYRIGFAARPDGMTLVEWSPTGRRFQITVRDGRARSQNVRGLAGILF
jgi:hypothetical protein